MVSGLLVIDLIIMLAWQLLDPLQRRVELFPLEDPISSADDSKIRPELEHCESHNNNVWLSIMYAYKGLVLVSGFLNIRIRMNTYVNNNNNNLCFLDFWIVPCLWDKVVEGQADKWFKICGNEYLQRCNIMFDNGAGHHGHCQSAGC